MGLNFKQFLGAQYAKLFMTSLQVNDKIHVEPSRNIYGAYFLLDIL
jgi:hypothetical protein